MLKIKHRDTIDLSKRNYGDLVYIGVYTSKECNLRCKYCFEDSGTTIQNETSLDRRLSTISQAKDLGAEVLFIAGAGEPLVDKKLFSMISYAHKLGMGTLLYTNGLENDSSMKASSMKSDTARFLYDHDVTVMLKIESTDPKVHDYLTSVKGSHQKVMKSFATLQNVGYGNIEDNITRLGIAALYTKANLYGLTRLRDWAEENNTQLYVDVVGVHGRAEKHKQIIPPKSEIIKLQKMLGHESGIAASGDCIFWKYGLTIDHHGNGRYCTEVDTRDIGNIGYLHLKDILELKNRVYPSKPGEFTCPLKEEHYLGIIENDS